MFQSSTIQTACISIAIFIAQHIQADAALVTYHGDLAVALKTAGFNGNEVQIGDSFHWQFTIDDSALDDDPSLSRGNFYNNFRDIYFVPASTNVGSWNPVPVKIANDVSQMNTYPGVFNAANVVEENGSAITLYGNLVTQFQMNNLFIADIHDTGSGQTWGEQVSNLSNWGVMDIVYGSSPIDNSPEIVRLSISDFGDGPNPAIVAIPEPSSLTFAEMCAVGIICSSWNRARKRKSCRSNM